MNVALFLSRRISKEASGSFSSIINRIAVVSIALGLAVLILAFFVLYGFKEEIKNKIYSLSGHLIVSKYSMDTSFEENNVVITDSLKSLLLSRDEVEKIQPYAMKAGLLKTKNEVQGVIIKGVDNDFDTTRFSRHLVQGRFPSFGKGYSTEVALSARIANYLSLGVGDDCLIYFVQNPPRYRKLTVTAIYETGLEEFDEKIIFGDLDLIRRINNWPDSVAGGVEIYIQDSKKLEPVEEDLFYAVPADLYVDKVSDKYSQIFDWLQLLNRNVIILLVIILVVSCTSIISIMLILIMERTQMIGILKAIGAPNALIRKSFVWNGILLITKGLFWGNLIGISIGVVQKYFKVIPLDARNYYMSHVPIQFDWLTVVFLNILVLGMITLTLYVPVKVIGSVQPVKAIRFD
jgi:lipoprotein-releasing system permease protein